MNKKRALYESIMKNVAKQVKNALNEADDFSISDFEEFMTSDDNNEYIDLDRMQEFSEEQLNLIVSTIIENGEMEVVDSEANGQVVTVAFFAGDNMAENIILRSADYFGVEVEAEVSCDVSMEYHEGDNGDGYYQPRERAYTDGKITDIQVNDVTLTDGSTNEVSINNDSINELVSNSISDDIFDEYINYSVERYDPDEYFDED